MELFLAFDDERMGLVYAKGAGSAVQLVKQAGFASNQVVSFDGEMPLLFYLSKVEDPDDAAFDRIEVTLDSVHQEQLQTFVESLDLTVPVEAPVGEPEDTRGSETEEPDEMVEDSGTEPLVFSAENLHPPVAGEPPALHRSGVVTTYTGYFEDYSGNQWVFEYRHQDEQGMLRGGRTGWDHSYLVRFNGGKDGEPLSVHIDTPQGAPAAALDRAVRGWLAACGLTLQLR